MIKKTKTCKVNVLQKGVATTILLSTLALQVIPVVQVGAETVTYNHEGINRYQTIKGDYIIEVNPMAEVYVEGWESPRGGQYVIKQVEQYDSGGRDTKVEGKEVALNITKGDKNKFILNSDGLYEIRNTKRIPGFFIDTTTYKYAVPLVENGNVQEEQVINFQPKIAPVLGDVEITKVGETGEPINGSVNKLYQIYDSTTGEGTNLASLGKISDDDKPKGKEIAEITTGKDGKIKFTDLREGQYYLQEESAVEGYALNRRRVEFEVSTDDTGQEVVVRGIGDYLLTGGKQNIISYRRVSFENYATTVEGVKGKQGSNVSTDSIISYTTDVTLSKDIGQYKEFKIESILPDTLEILEGSVIVTGYSSNDTKDLSEHTTIARGEDGKKVLTLLAEKGSDLQDELKDLETLHITYNAQVETNKVSAEDVLTTGNVISWDNDSGDVGTMEDAVSVTVKEGALEVLYKEEKGEVIKGTEFTIYVKGVGEGEVEYKGDSYIPAVNPRTGKEYIGITGEDGRLVFNSIPFGDYILVLTGTPEGYLETNEVLDVTIEDVEEPAIEGVEDSKQVIVYGVKSDEATIIDIVGSKTRNKVTKKEDAKGNEKFQQTGASVMWGALLGGAFTTVLGSYLMRKEDE